MVTTPWYILLSVQVYDFTPKVGVATTAAGKHVHEFNMHDLTDGFNTSHEIHSMSFGDVIPGAFSPLEGVTKTVNQGVCLDSPLRQKADDTMQPTNSQNRWC
eukprot:6035900-Amphidinium_carterae.1